MISRNLKEFLQELWLRTPPNNTVRADMMLVKAP